MSDTSWLAVPFEVPTAEKPLVISSSSLAEFTFCRKSYEIAYVWGLESNIRPRAMENGTSFHKIMEALNGTFAGRPPVDPAKGGVDLKTILAPPALPPTFADFTMDDVAREYIRRRALPLFQERVARIIYIEEPIYVEVLPHVFLRITPDIVEEWKSGEIVMADYKTYSKSEEWDTALNFQARLYTAILAMWFPGHLVRFQHRKVRSTPCGVPRGAEEQEAAWRAARGEVFKSGPRKGELPTWQVWEEENCYEEIDTVYSPRELEVVWAETVDKVRDLVRAHAEGRFYRISAPWYTGPGSCSNCMNKVICLADIEESLDKTLIESNTSKRKPLVVNHEQLLAVPLAAKAKERL